MRMTKRELMGAAVGGLATASWAGAARAAPLKVRISTAAVDADWHARMLGVFKDELEKALPGQVDVEIHLNASLFKQGTEPAAMQRGNLEMALLSAFDVGKQVPAWTVFTAGYLIRDPDHLKKVFDGPIGEEFFKLVEDQLGIRMLAVAYLGTRQLNLRGNKKIMTPADLAGVKLRMPGTEAWQFLGKALGANPTPMAFGEVYTGLQSGAIDAQDNPLPTNRAAKFYEVTNQIVMTNHLVDAIFISVSGKVWSALNDQQKQAFKTAARKARDFNDAGRIKDEEELVAFFRSQKLDVYSPDLDAFRKQVQSAYLASPHAKDWPAGIVDRVNAVK